MSVRIKAAEEERAVILLIARDIMREIHKRDPDYNFNTREFRIKLHCAIFAIAEDLGIPITRSWYGYFDEEVGK